MSVIEKSVALGGLHHYLSQVGITVEELSDMSLVQEYVRQIGKPYLTPISSPDHNDFTESNVLWQVAKRGDEVVYMGCARLEDIGLEPVGKYWGRVFRRAYGAGMNDVICSTRPEIERQVGGRMVYFGDLYAAQGARGNRAAIRAFVAIGHLAVSLKWNPDWTYCFVREADVLRGAATLYGFTSVMPSPFEWIGRPPHPRSDSECLVTLPRSEVISSARAAMRYSAAKSKVSDDQKREVQD